MRRTKINMNERRIEQGMPQAERILLRSSPSEDTSPEMGLLLGHALAMDHRKVVVGRDLMRSSSMMKEALVAGLMSSGADVIDVGIVTCPALAMAASKGDCAVYVTEYRGYGMISGYLLVNTNGSLFRREQIRHLDKFFMDPPELPESGSLGHVFRYLDAVNVYNSRVRSLHPDRAECTIVLDCNCGPVAESAPQILNAMGADVLSMNAQRDLDYRSGEMDDYGICSDEVRRQVESSPGSIGIAMNKAGTMASILDERGRELTPEQVFALTVMFLRPKSIAVPIDTTMLVDDAFHGRLDGGEDPDTDLSDGETGLVRTTIGAAAVCEAVASGAELGFYDGGIMYGNLSMMPDGIQTAAVIAGMAGNNSINQIVDGFPEYLRNSTAIDCPCSAEAFAREMEARIQDVEGTRTVRGDAWRVDMEGGWYLIRLARCPDLSVEIIAESKDKAYLIGLMEIAGDLVGECVRSQ